MLRVLSCFLMIVLCVGAGCSTQAVRSESSDFIATSERIDAGDAQLYVQVRGQKAGAPLLLWLHGGPGGAERPLFRYFNHELEQYFLVAYLDQRGAGRSFDPEAPASRLTVAQHLSDLDRVIHHLQEQFGRDRVLLVGHSWGTVLGMLYAEAHPENVLGLICVAPVVSFVEHQRREYEFDLAEATRRQDESALATLEEIGRAPYPDPGPMLRLQRVTEGYRGVEYQHHNHAVIVVKAVLQGLVTPLEIRQILRGSRYSLSAMHAELNGFDMRREVEALEVPVFFFLGRHDTHVDANLANEYFMTLSAPRKQAWWFEQSAHDIPFDEPELFDARVVEIGESLAAQVRSGEG